MTTQIEWTWVPDGNGGCKKGETWNPAVGCFPVSPGCLNCYAEGVAGREMSEQHKGLTQLRIIPKSEKGKVRGGKRWNGLIRLVPKMLAAPLHWRDPRGVFVGSMTDLFHEENVGYEVRVEHVASMAVPWWTVVRADGTQVGPMWRLPENGGDGALVFGSEAEAEVMARAIRGRHEQGRRYIAAIFWVMALTQQHTYMLLTKRPENEAAWFGWLDDQIEKYTDRRDARGQLAPTRDEARSAILAECLREYLGESQHRVAEAWPPAWPLQNVWLGCTTEDRKRFDERKPILAELPAVVHFLSCEPLVEDLGDVDLSGIQWVIAGGESGQSARPSHPDWFRSLRNRCVAAGVPYFMKQWGEWAEVGEQANDIAGSPGALRWTHMVSRTTGRAYASGEEMPMSFVSEVAAGEAAFMRKVGKANAGRELDDRTWDQFPEVV